MKNQSTTKTVLSFALAALIGACASGLCMNLGFSASFLFLLVFISPMLSMFLYGFGGVFPAITMLAVTEVGAFYTLGPIWSLILLIAVAIPSAEMIYMSSRGAPFFKQIRFALATQAVALVALLVLANLLGGADLSTLAAQYLRTSIDEMGDELRSVMASLVRSLYAAVATELPQDDLELLTWMAAQYEQALKISLPIMLVMLTGYNAGLGVLWGNFLRARHGEKNVKYVPISGWRMPVGTIVGLIVSLIVTYILSGSAEWAMVFTVVLSIAILACQVQAAASIMNRMRMSGMSARMRIILFIAIELFMGVYLIIYGALSMLIGSRGLLAFFVKAKMEKNNKSNKEE